MGTAMALDRGSVETSRSMATTVAQLKWTRHFRLDLATADADHLDKPDRRGTKPASSRTSFAPFVRNGADVRELALASLRQLDRYRQMAVIAIEARARQAAAA